MASVGIIVPAAGSGKRFGEGLPKQYQLLRGEPLIVHTIRTILRVKGLASVVIAVSPTDDMCKAVLESAGIHDDRLNVIVGGSERQFSIQKALDHPSIADVDVILVHDGVRPLATHDLFDSVVIACDDHIGVIPVLPAVNTIKRVDALGTVIETIPREQLRIVQTPQGFRSKELREAYRNALDDSIVVTDDSALMESSGFPVSTVHGEAWNIKVTTPADLKLAEFLFDQK